MGGFESCQLCVGSSSEDILEAAKELAELARLVINGKRVIKATEWEDATKKIETVYSKLYGGGYCVCK